MKIIFNDKIQEFLDYCSNNNIELYLVGGALRDYLINKETYDYDFALTTNYEKAIEVIKNKYQCQIDKKYYSIKLRIDNYTIEITHARGENNYLDYRHPSEIELCSDIKEDSKRRDFTINALYYKNEKIYDFYNGIDDLKNNRLRVIGDTLTRFKEDPLRILRMIRFSCLGYSISVEDERIILDSNYLLKELSSFAFEQRYSKPFLSEWMQSKSFLIKKL